MVEVMRAMYPVINSKHNGKQIYFLIYIEDHMIILIRKERLKKNAIPDNIMFFFGETVA